MLKAETETERNRAPEPLRFDNLEIGFPVVQAALSGYSDAPMRVIARRHGASYTICEVMLDQFLVCMKDRKRTSHFLHIEAEEHPVGGQLMGAEPAQFSAGAAKLVEAGFDVIDINFGCPVRQVTQKAHSGSYLLRFPDRMAEIIERVVEACRPTPVTAKIRLGCTRDQINAIDVAQVVEGAGAAALTVHGRTAADFFKGSADWNRIAEIKSYLRHIPLIGNGDLDSAQKVVEAFRRYDVDGVMIARACLGRPWLFQQAAAALRGEEIPADPSIGEQRECMLRHYDLVVDRFGIEKGTLLMRKYACCYAQGKPGARHFRAHVASVSTPDAFHSVVREYFPRD